MPTVRPFVGLLHDLAIAGSIDAVTAPPYDTISPIDQERYHRASPFNVVRLILGREEPGDDESNNKYTRAASYLRTWRREGVLKPTGPAVFPYEFQFRHAGSERSVRGLIVEVELEPWGGSILPHERTMPGPVEDRLRLLREVRTNLSPIYGVFGGPSATVSELLDRVTSQPPDRELTDENGTRHRLWIAQDGIDELTPALQEDELLIADGHHRYTVALSYRDEMRAQFGPGPWDGMLMLIVDGAVEDPPVLPIHRVVEDDADLDWMDGRRVRDMAEVLSSLDDDALTIGMVTLDDGEPVHRVASLSGSPPTVCALHEQILDRLAGQAMRFVPDAVAAEQAVLSGAASAAFLLPPTRVDRVRAVIQGGGRLPQKSTYFWPKPRTGMVIRPFD